MDKENSFMPNLYRNVFFSIAVIIFSTVSHGQIVSGSASLKLSGPSDKANRVLVQIRAMESLKTELLRWLENEAEISIDTTNPVAERCFNMFLDTCRKVAKTESSFSGKKLTITYLLSGKQIRNKIESFNRTVDTLAVNAWRNLTDARSSNAFGRVYVKGLTGLFYTLAHLGPPLATPDSGGRDLADDFRRTVQEVFDRMSVKSTGLILTGKTGHVINDLPEITIQLDSLPLPGVTVSGRLQNGTVLFSSSADENGTITIEQFKMPFVANGTLFEIGPNVAPVLGLTGFIDPVDLGIRLDKGQVQSCIFKLIKTVYTLDYKASAVNTITLPPDFASPIHVNKFLRDSCFLKERTGGEPVDLAITIQTQVASYTYDETEEIGIKVTSQIKVNGLLLKPPREKTNTVVFEKRYNRYLKLPYGLYFWEANGKIREAIRATIAGL